METLKLPVEHPQIGQKEENVCDTLKSKQIGRRATPQERTNRLSWTWYDEG